jgi:phosphoribosylformylglycinamidine (FGAM) synthase PurS component
MIDPATIAAGAIAKLAFDEFVKSGAGEVAKKTVGGAVELVKTLRDRIKAKFQGNERATAALSEVEQNGSEAALEKVGKYLDLEMDEEQGFADEVRQMAQQIINIQNQTTHQMERQYNNYGRDQINIERVDKIEHLGGS